MIWLDDSVSLVDVLGSSWIFSVRIRLRVYLQTFCLTAVGEWAYPIFGANLLNSLPSDCHSQSSGSASRLCCLCTQLTWHFSDMVVEIMFII